MKKHLALSVICLLAIKLASAQIIPSFEFGLKGGMNLSKFSHTATFATGNRAGYLGGVWARVGGLGFNFQPELYITGKNVTINNNNGTVNKASFTSLDVPLLLGSKIGAFGVGGRFYTGPLFSLALYKDQNLGAALGNVARLNYKDQSMAWTFGAGLDIKKISVDLRYEYGLSKQPYNNGQDETRVNIFNLTLGYRLFSL
ncbi:PorT family protein [Mucilaginibacter mali]|uniref:PorT family protein n=1 Tax=Mucilaginibacter mali TaxID=2740462 RepID=A0A7D4UAD5_9SPHI|nr:porin family protein [Mucilaginibacter mali]QKJ29858.1 PorT family protein [Mucilaginibacter mali]